MMIDLRQIKGGVALQQAINALNTSYDASKVLIDGDENVKAAVERLGNEIKTVDGKFTAKADLRYVDDELGKKADQDTVTAALDLKATKEEVKAGLELKANKEEVENNLNLKANKADLGTVASKNIGTEEGQVPVLGAEGKLDAALLPSIAINETFVVENEEKAMEKTVEVGDIVVVNYTDEGGEAITYIAVDMSKDTFDEKFRPLRSSADSVTKTEFNQALANKADKSQVATDIAAAKTELNETITANKSEIDGRLDGHDTKIGSIEQEIKKINDSIYEEVVELINVDADDKTELTIKAEPVAGTVVRLFVNGIQYTKDVDWSIEGTTITWKDVDFKLGNGFAVMVEYSKVKASV